MGKARLLSENWKKERSTEIKVLFCQSWLWFSHTSLLGMKNEKERKMSFGLESHVITERVCVYESVCEREREFDKERARVAKYGRERK